MAVVTPWNFPLALPLRHTAAAVAAGNAVVLKPSELTPQSGAWVEELFRRAGAPAGLVRVVQGPGETVGDALVRHRGIGGVVFTGSTEVGRSVAQAAAERLRPAVLELGGKDPMLVLDDADLDRAVEGALWGSFANCGQACAGIERIAVPPGLHDTFVERLAARAAELRIGHGADPLVELGPLVSEEQRARFEGLVADAVEHGAHGRERWPSSADQPAGLVPRADGAPRRAARRPHPHRGALRSRQWSLSRRTTTRRWFAGRTTRPTGSARASGQRDVERARDVASRLDVGMTWVNDHAYSFGAGQTPWGGRRASGLGTTASRHGLYALSRPTFSDADRGRLTPGWWYPYSDRSVDGFRGVLGGLYADGALSRAANVWTHRRGLVHLAGKVLR